MADSTCPHDDAREFPASAREAKSRAKLGTIRDDRAMTSANLRPLVPHPVFGALGARADGELARLGVRREDIPWRGLVLRVARNDIATCLGEF